MSSSNLVPKRMLLIAAGLLAAGLFTGTIVISIGVGSQFTSLNTVMSPLVCPGDDIVPAWKYRGRPALASGPDLRTRWICVDKAGVGHVAGFRTIFTAGAVYGLILAALGFFLFWRKGVFRKDSQA
jgi:hypothetical protein